MPFVFLILGIVLLIVAVKGTQGDMFALLKSEFTGSNNFLVWVMAIAVLGALGYVKPIKPIANGMLFLVLLVIVVKNGGTFFSSFNQQVANPVAPSGSAGNVLPSFSLPSFSLSLPGFSTLAPGAATPAANTPAASPWDQIGVPLGYST